jgi:hypothetical protein
MLPANGKICTNEKDASTFVLTVRPLSGTINTGLLLNSDGGARVKKSQNLDIYFF